MEESWDEIRKRTAYNCNTPYRHRILGETIAEFWGEKKWRYCPKTKQVIVKVADKMNIYLLPAFDREYVKCTWGGKHFTCISVRHMRVIKIGRFVLKHKWYVVDAHVPINGYLHEDSPLYDFLVFLKLFRWRHARRSNIIDNYKTKVTDVRAKDEGDNDSSKDEREH